MLEKKVNTAPVDYAALNQLYKDFETRFVPQIELSAEQAFWSQNSVNSPEPILSSRPTIVKVPKELPKVSMVNTSLKKLKHHLAGFDVALKDLFNTFNQYLVNELSEFQNVFLQMEQAVEQHCLESKTFEVKMNQVLNENERLLEQVLSKDIEIFQRDNPVSNQSTLSFDQFFELSELKSQSQEKDTIIKKLKERIKSLSGKQNENKIKKDLEEIETINIELDHRVTKLIAENEHLKQTYKQLYDSIKPTRIRSKEQCDDLINQVNLKSVEISKLNAILQEKVLVLKYVSANKKEPSKSWGSIVSDVPSSSLDEWQQTVYSVSWRYDGILSYMSLVKRPIQKTKSWLLAPTSVSSKLRTPAAAEYSQTLTCYEYGGLGHYKRDCPELKNQNHENQAGSMEARRVVHAFGGGETKQDLNNIEDEIEA
ncbi:retrovirus-related pol polyprotein from transposon TNT 1-94 [Tanacetum coccineum]